MKSSFLACDFDHTLAYLQGGEDSLFLMLDQLGVPKKIAKAAFQKASDEGFSIHSFLVHMESMAPSSHPIPPRDTIITAISRWLKLSLSLYPEVPVVLPSIQHRAPVAIVTVGDEEFQKEKIRLANVPHNLFLPVPKRGMKHKAIAKLLDELGAPAIFVDDNPEELDAAREHGLTAEQLLTFRIKRPESPYVGLNSKYPHTEISSLTIIQAVIDTTL
ncbi:hypothetical protein D6779_03575 [Candidatus Parcubacteria bacterium]|nr:MAG: hypothetical protein D6779_03575 [Candidatus Parcubacteria bacterium]